MLNGTKYDIFICYRGSSDGALIGEILFNHLKKEFPKLNTFFAPRCIPKGEDFEVTIKYVIKDVRCFVIVMTDGFLDNCINEDDVVKKEIKMALADNSIEIVPVSVCGYSFIKDDKLLEKYAKGRIFSKGEREKLCHLNLIPYNDVYGLNRTLADIDTTIRNNMDILIFDSKRFRIVADGKKIVFGRYPQNQVEFDEERDIISQAEKSNRSSFDGTESYLMPDGTEYVRASINYNNKDSSRKEVGKSALFKVSPLKWDVIYEDYDCRYQVLLSDMLIDTKKYYQTVNHQRIDENGQKIANNSWEYSDIRRWLNSSFYDAAFSDSEKRQIVEAMIPCGEKNSNDKVFLISHDEMYHQELFPISTSQVTDYAKAVGAYASTSASHKGNGDWWTRTPGVDGASLSVENIDRRGCVENVKPFCNYVDDSAVAVRPMLIRKLDYILVDELTYRFLENTDKDALYNLIAYTDENMQDESWWLPISDASRDHFFDSLWTMFLGVYKGNELVAASALFLNENEYGKSCGDIGLSTDNVAEIGRCMVKREYRGNNLMLMMNRKLVNKARTMGIKNLLATVHPDNISSYRSLEHLGMKKRKTVIKQEKYVRAIFTMNIENAN